MHISRLITVFFLCMPFFSCEAAESAKAIEENVKFEYSVEDNKLNTHYLKLRKDLDSESKKNLLRMQRAWILYRDRVCDYAFPLDEEYGSIAKTENILCKTIATKFQSKELQRLKNLELSKKQNEDDNTDYPTLLCQLFGDKNKLECTSRIKRNEQIISNLGNEPKNKLEVKNHVSSLPFTDKQINPRDSSGMLKNDFPLSGERYMDAINKLIGGSSDSGFYILPNINQTKVFIGFGLFENESEKYVASDNPYGMFVEQENYLITENNGDLYYVRLNKVFYIGSDYKDIYTVKDNAKEYFMILPNGKIKSLE